MRHVALVAALLVMLCGCYSAPRETVVIATDAAFEPFHMLDEDGLATGHDVELATAVMKHAGYEPHLRVVGAYKDLFTGLNAGDHDMVAATTGITEARKQLFRFSQPYFTTCQAAVVRDNSNIEQLDDLMRMRIGAPAGTTSADAARSLSDVTVIEFASGRDAVSDLKTGHIDALIADEFEVVALARMDNELRVLSQPVTIEHYGFVYRMNDEDLQAAINDALQEMRRRGTLETLRRKYGLNRSADWPVELEANH